MSQAFFGPYLECSLSIAVDLVNTAHEGHEHLKAPADLARFLSEHEVSDVRRPTKRDLDEVRRVRSRLRDTFEADDPTHAGQILNELLAASNAVPVLTDHDGQPWHLHFTPPGTPIGPRLAAETAMALSVVIAEDGFDRLRGCDSETCEDVFVDVSKNRSRKYCTQNICGNRASVRAYRERQRHERGGTKSGK